MVTGKHAKLELFDEDENHKPVLSSRQVYATSTDIAGNIELQRSNSSSNATSSVSKNQATAKRLAFSPSPSKKKSSPNRGQWIEANAIFAGSYSTPAWIKN